MLNLRTSLIIFLIMCFCTIAINAQDKPNTDTTATKANHNTTRTTCCQIVFEDDVVDVIIDDKKIKKTYRKYFVNQRKAGVKRIETFLEYKNGLKKVIAGNIKALFPDGRPKIESETMSVSIVIKYKGEFNAILVKF